MAINQYFWFIFRGQKNNDGDRALFCELYDGDTQEVVRSSSDFKTQKRMVTEVTMSICGFQQPDPFLLDYMDLCARKDGFLDRFHFVCPESSLLSLEEVREKVDGIKQLPEQLRSMAEMYNVAKNVHLLSSPTRYRCV